MFDTKEQLLDAVDDFCIYKNTRAQIVFDGYCNDDMSTNLVQVDFTGDADFGIIEIMNKYEASSLILVTSDREILRVAREKKINHIKSEDFNLRTLTELPPAPGEETDAQLTDDEVESQLKEFNNFQK